MNKLTIPTILAATVMVAGIFAFMPVEQASTVHTTIQATTAQIQSVDSTAADFAVTTDDELRISSSDAYQLIGLTCTWTDPQGTLDVPAGAITVDGATATVANTVTDAASGGSTIKMLTDEAASGGYVSEGGTNSMVYDVGTLAQANANEDVDCIVTFLASGDDTITAVWTALGE